MGIRAFGLVAAAVISGLVSVPTTRAQTTIGTAPAEFRTITLNTFRGLPRVGIQDTKGYAPYGKRPTTTSNAKIRQNEAAAIRVSNGIEIHNYSLFLLAQLDFWRANPDCSKGIGSYEAKIERCAGLLVSYGLRGELWNSYIGTLAHALKPAVHAQVFCAQAGACGAVRLNQVNRIDSKGRPVRLDEFQKRDFFAQLKGTYFPKFERYYATTTMPKEAYFVTTATLGDYDFDNSRFNVRVSEPRGMGMQRGFANPSNAILLKQQEQALGVLRAKQITLTFEPKNGFETGLVNSSGQISAFKNVPFPMAPAKARNLVKGAPGLRTVFAVVKIGITQLSTDALRDRQRDGLSKRAYHFAANKIEFFSDESLTQKIGEVPIVAGSSNQQQAAANNLYQIKADSTLLDGRAYHYLRYGLGDLPEPDRDRLAQSVPMNERSIFLKLKPRLDELSRTYPAGNSAKAQAMIKERKQRAEDAAKFVNIAWTDRASWTPAQRDAYFDYILGYGPQTEPNFSAWPDALPSVPWGMNLATIFPKDHFDLDPASRNMHADAATMKQIEAFVSDVAARYAPKHLTAVYNLGGTRYDQKTRKLTFERWPFGRSETVSYSTGKSGVVDGMGQQLVHSDAKQRMIYRFRPSGAGVGDRQPDRVISSCALSQRRKSYDCGINWHAFMPLQWINTFFVLDRDLKAPTITLPPKQGLDPANNRAGWRLVVEFGNPEMKLVPFRYKQRNKKGTFEGEAQTLFANVERIVVLKPNGEILLSRTGSQLQSAASVTKITASKTAYTFPSPVPLGPDRQMDGALYDFLLAKYQPARLTDRMVDAMLSSRWAYESYVKAPLGGTFFNGAGRTPTSADLASLRPEFKAWLLERAARLPAQLSVDLPLIYAGDTVSVHTRCLEVTRDPAAPMRSNSANIKADQKARQCQTAHRGAVDKFERCESLRSDVSRAEASLSSAKSSGCKQTAAAPRAASGRCTINPNAQMNELAGEMQRCIREMCGGQPKTLGEMGTFQQCIQSAQTDLQEQMQAIVTGRMGGSTTASTAQSVNSCKSAEQDLYQARQSLKGARCDGHTAMPATPDCDFASKIEKPIVMPIIKMAALNNKRCASSQYFLRSHKTAASLLPGGQPYADTQLSVRFDLSNAVQIPYDSPIPTTPGRPINAKVVLSLTGLDRMVNDPQVLALKATPAAPTYSGP